MSHSRQRRNQLRKSFLSWKRQLIHLGAWDCLWEDCLNEMEWRRARRAAMREARTWNRLIRLRGVFTGKPLRDRKRALEGVKQVQSRISKTTVRELEPFYMAAPGSGEMP